MEAWLKLCGGALIIAVAALLLKSFRTETWPLRWLGILLTALACLAMLSPVLDFIRELCAGQGVSEYADLLFRALGVALLTQICADLCRESGEASLAAGVELAGKTELLLLSLPLLRRLLSAAGDLLSLL